MVKIKKTVNRKMPILLSVICCLSIVLIIPVSAYATITRGTMGVIVDSSVTVQVGGSTVLNCEPSPSSERQRPCCSTDYCPSGCEAGGSGGCLDSNGFCTCLGGDYYTAYATCTVSSDAPNVVRAKWSNGVLTIRGYTKGTANLRVSAKLSLWITKTVTVKVTVTEKPGGSGTSGNGSGSSNKGGSSAGSSTTGVAVSHVGSKKSTSSKSETVKSSSKINAASTNATNNKTSSGKKSDVKSNIEQDSEAQSAVTAVTTVKKGQEKSTFIPLLIIIILILIIAGAYVRYRIYKKQHQALDDQDVEAIAENVKPSSSENASSNGGDAV